MCVHRVVDLRPAKLYILCIYTILSKARICMQQHFFFLRLLIIDFVGNVYESPQDEIHGSVLILHVFAYFDYKIAKNSRN
jgi:hypothetical protein